MGEWEQWQGGGYWDPYADDEGGGSMADKLKESIPLPGSDKQFIKRDFDKAWYDVLEYCKKKEPWSKIYTPAPDLSWHKPTCTFANWTHKEVKVALSDGIVYITMNRPSDNNLLSGDIVAGLVDALFLLHENKDGIRVAVFTGEGKMFCGGGDGEGGGGFDLNNPVIKDMEAKATASGAFPSGNVSMGRVLHAKLWHVWITIPQFSICLCNGSALGDGIGCVAASDYAISVTGAQFCLSDVKFGMCPGNLGPYVVSKVGLASAKKIFCTGEIINAEQAKQYKLINEVVADMGASHKHIKELCEDLTKAGPRTVAATKTLIAGVQGRAMSEPLMFYTSEVYAQTLASEEFQQAAKGDKPWEKKPIKPLF
jgi:enoyl-CoA hydratase/carnithine racemase